MIDRIYSLLITQLEVFMFWRKKRPTFIKGNTLINATIDYNTVSGDADFLDVKSA